MSLPKIDNPTPVTKEAVAAKTYDSLFVRELIITCHPDTPWRCSAVCVPYNYDLNEVDETSQPKHMHIEDLRVESAKNEKVALAMGMLLDAIKDYIV
jgi:hypothetical protein